MSKNLFENIGKEWQKFKLLYVTVGSLRDPQYFYTQTSERHKRMGTLVVTFDGFFPTQEVLVRRWADSSQSITAIVHMFEMCYANNADFETWAIISS